MIVARRSIHRLERWLTGSGAMLSPLHFYIGDAIHSHLRGEVALVDDKKECDLVYGIMEREVIVDQWRLSCDQVEEIVCSGRGDGSWWL
ncbi:hypothetical protein NC652_038302 [Populus alba x Populus x berolinensis]|nr:hypothetical protein NC652_038302 [Populus alba x Populus x berolinensis]